ncbi:MAG TPA: ABC transporter ATP-binding protein, partial [Bacteroidia bacterium]|nr:ABC transporter ATP-binding protein [Bacteroidia bacterium]
NTISIEEMIQISGLSASRKKMMKYFSSGMKQRVKLILALLSDVEVVFLDEPCSNLDRSSIEWYQELVKNYAANKTIIVCSNSQSEEYSFCTREINVMSFKPAFSMQ